MTSRTTASVDSMAVLIRFRSLIDDAEHALAVESGRWMEPETVRIDSEHDYRSFWGLPGLADAHAHLSASSVNELIEATSEDIEAAAPRHAWAQLAGGVFLVFDKGSRTQAVLAILDEPPARRPDMEMAGTLIAVPGGYYPGFGVEVDPDEVVRAVAQVSGNGASWVKLIGDWPRRGGPRSNFSFEQLSAAVDAAHRAGCRVAIHTAAPETATTAVAAGVDSIEHGLFMTGDDLEALGARGGAWVPTIAAMEGVRDLLGEASSGGRLFADGLANVRTLLAGAPDVGVSVLAGTDLHLAHGAVASEVLRLREYGLSIEDALDSTGATAYRYSGRPYDFALGNPADLVLLAGDPREHLDALVDPVRVLRHGRFIR